MPETYIQILAVGIGAGLAIGFIVFFISYGITSAFHILKNI